MNLIDLFLNLLYPSKCIFCRRILKDGEEGLCEKCIKLIPRLKADHCRRDIKNIRLCVFPFAYKDKVRDSLLRYKFSNATAYASIYTDFIAKSIDENGISCDIISWVPIHRKRYRERGYDQSELIAKALSVKTGIPCQRLLVKEFDNKRQSSIEDRDERRRNVAGVYRSFSCEELLGKRVLLVDDIITSGATIAECASVLKGIGCTEIYAAAVAAVVP